MALDACKFRPHWPRVTMWLLISDFLGNLCLKHCILVSHKLWAGKHGRAACSCEKRLCMLQAEEGEAAVPGQPQDHPGRWGLSKQTC